MRKMMGNPTVVSFFLLGCHLLLVLASSKRSSDDCLSLRISHGHVIPIGEDKYAISCFKGYKLHGESIFNCEKLKLINDFKCSKQSGSVVMDKTRIGAKKKSRRSRKFNWPANENKRSAKEGGKGIKNEQEGRKKSSKHREAETTSSEEAMIMLNDEASPNITEDELDEEIYAQEDYEKVDYDYEQHHRDDESDQYGDYYDYDYDEHETEQQADDEQDREEERYHQHSGDQEQQLGRIDDEDYHTEGSGHEEEAVSVVTTASTTSSSSSTTPMASTTTTTTTSTTTTATTTTSTTTTTTTTTSTTTMIITTTTTTITTTSTSSTTTFTANTASTTHLTPTTTRTFGSGSRDDDIVFSDDEDYYDSGSGDSVDEQDLGSGQDGSGDLGEVSTTPRQPPTRQQQQDIRFDFYFRFGIDILRVDTSCVEKFVNGPDVPNAKITGYDHGVPNPALHGKFYAKVEYACLDGFQLKYPDTKSLFCSENQWEGNRPVCISEDSDGSNVPVKCSESDAKDCDQMCLVTPDDKPLCQCFAGYEFDKETGKTCVDIDECSVNNGNCDYMCINKPGTYMCDCLPGYQSLDNNCIDVNECVLNNGHGPCQDRCHNTEGGYFCSCEGLPGTTLSKNNHTCDDNNGCSSNNGGCSHKCMDVYNKVYCLCPTGFQLQDDWKTCQDVDECQGILECPQLCVNTPGSAHCQCHPGYVETELGDCVDVNECEEGNHCSHNCTNTQGSFACSCPDGFELDDDNETCQDKNECEWGVDNCQQVCINKQGGFECGCHPGYHMIRSISNSTCYDIDECQEITDLCGQGDCINGPGSYECQCHPGFEMKVNSEKCEDIDECEPIPDICGSGGTCLNSMGSYDCDCQLGFEFVNGTCLDFNECVLGNPCINGDCYNQEPGYGCLCFKGYSLKDGACFDIDECQIDQGICGPAGQCMNIQGSYECQCHKGFEFVDGTCKDINECKLGDKCRPHGDCINIEGSFYCECHPGYVLSEDKTVCVDLDECSSSSPCKNAKCQNLLGSYTCQCNPGYKPLDKNTCEDVNECSVESGGCQHRCVNLPGSFACECNDGFRVSRFDEKLCEDHDECQAGGNGGCEQLCLNEEGSHSCKCREGFITSPSNTSACQDVDECEDKICDHHCLNQIGSFQCSCQSGYILRNQTQCVDEDECRNGQARCSHDCVNVPGGFKCLCPTGFRLTGDGRTCKLVPTLAPCRSIKRPKYGVMRCNKRKIDGFFPVGTRCKLKCRPGFKPTRMMRKKCVGNFSWTGSDAKCLPNFCPKIPNIENGFVEPSSCSKRGQKVGKSCKFSCNSGYSLAGTAKTHCRQDHQWDGLYNGQPPKCAPNFPKPFILCPADITKSLPGKASSVYVMFSQPKSNVDWFRYVDSEPPWAKQLEGAVTRGKHVITFKARNPIGSESASCQMIIHVKDTEPPRVKQCPESFTEYLADGEKSRKISWKEPIFHDNVKIQHVMASYLPGHEFSLGRYHVLYQATDADGNKARCGFTINVRGQHRRHRHKLTNLPSPLGGSHYSRNGYHLPKSCNNIPKILNGKMECFDTSIGRKCTPVCDIEHIFYQKFTSRAPIYLCNKFRNDWQLRRFIPDCSPVHKAVHNRKCLSGWEARGPLCVACPPGMYRKSQDQLCQLCPKGSYAEDFGSRHCKSCMTGETTKGLGSKTESHCYAKSPNYSIYANKRKNPLGFRYYNRWMTDKKKAY